MSQHLYAKDQPQGFRNHLEKVAIVGEVQIGKYMARALLRTGQHKLTAITGGGLAEHGAARHEREERSTMRTDGRSPTRSGALARCADHHPWAVTAPGDGDATTTTTTKINTTTWLQCSGRTAAVLLGLEIPLDDDRSPTLFMFRNNVMCEVLSPRSASGQRDLFDSVLRVLGDSETGWTVTYEDVEEAYKSKAASR